MGFTEKTDSKKVNIYPKFDGHITSVSYILNGPIDACKNTGPVITHDSRMGRVKSFGEITVLQGESSVPLSLSIFLDVIS